MEQRASYGQHRRPLEGCSRAFWSIMKVLIVDDDQDVADSLAMLIRVVLDDDVCVRYSGQGAMDVAGDHRPGVVILDLNMPEMDGVHATIEKRSSIATQDVHCAHCCE